MLVLRTGWRGVGTPEVRDEVIAARAADTAEAGRGVDTRDPARVPALVPPSVQPGHSLMSRILMATSPSQLVIAWQTLICIVAKTLGVRNVVLNFILKFTATTL